MVCRGRDGYRQATLPATGGESSALPGGGELAVGEEADYKLAMSDLEAENYQAAADRFANFNLLPRVCRPPGRSAWQGAGRLGDTRQLRSYLAAFTGDIAGAIAPEALFELVTALGRWGQTDQACITLAEVAVRFPNDPAVTAAEAERPNRAPDADIARPDR